MMIDTATAQILTMGSVGLAFLLFINWLEKREKKKDQEPK